MIDALDECDDKDMMAEFIALVIGSFEDPLQMGWRRRGIGTWVAL